MAGFPIILGGDHAAFEAEWAASGRPDDERPDWPLPSFDARDWAEAFCSIAKKHGHDIDKEWMVTWFANALMRGYDEHAARIADLHTDMLDTLEAWQRAQRERDAVANVDAQIKRDEILKEHRPSMTAPQDEQDSNLS